MCAGIAYVTSALQMHYAKLYLRGQCFLAAEQLFKEPVYPISERAIFDNN